jgi:hypothetical protein
MKLKRERPKWRHAQSLGRPGKSVQPVGVERRLRAWTRADLALQRPLF